MMNNDIKWINVEDELPDDETTVLLAGPHEYMQFGYIIGQSQWWSCEDKSIRKTVTHWAEVPKHPDEQEEQ